MSTPRSGATPILLAGVVVLGGVVLYRNFFSAPLADEEADTAPTPRERYLEELALSRRQDALIEQWGLWEGALVGARSAWVSVSRVLVRGRTIELAEAGFRERVLAEVKDLKFIESSANTQRVEAAPATQPAPSNAASAPAAAAVRTIGLKVDVRTDSPAEVYRLIDRLENMPDTRAGVIGVELRGPGLAQTPGEVSATITVHALALIGEGTS